MGRRTFSALGLLGLYTESPLHCGAESGSGYVDLPIQRERHTHYPVIPGSTLKGVLRDEMAGGDGLSEEDIRHFFGYRDSEERDTRPGRVAFGDGILAAFPVRSSETPFHWVTCPFVLERVLRNLGAEPLGEQPAKGEAWVAEAPDNGPVILEELALRRKARPELFDPEKSGSVAHSLLALLPPEDRGFGYTRQIFPHRLLIVSDEDFAELVEIGTEVVTRIKLNFLGTTNMLDRKEYKGEEHANLEDEEFEGNLFVQEVLPPETLFVAPLRALEDEGQRFADALDRLDVIRIGGDETVGRGVTHTRWSGPASDDGKGD